MDKIGKAKGVGGSQQTLQCQKNFASDKWDIAYSYHENFLTVTVLPRYVGKQTFNGLIAHLPYGSSLALQFCNLIR